MAEKTIAPPHKSFRGQCPEGNAVEAAFLKKAPPQTLPGNTMIHEMREEGEMQFPECGVGVGRADSRFRRRP